MDNNAEFIAKLAASQNAPAAATNAHAEMSSPYVLVPEGYEVRDLEKMFPSPARLSGKVMFRDVASFSRAVNEAKTNSTRIYGDPLKPGFRAVFNDHHQGKPGWGDHQALYDCPLSVEWKTWTGNDKKQMNQEAFAQFIEDNAPDCHTPPSADMIEISRTLEAKKKVNFASGVRLANGQNELTYEEEITGTAAKGRLALPEIFTVAIPVLQGGSRYAVNARLRYRIVDKGVLIIWYDLERPHKILEDAVLGVDGVWKQIEADTGLKIFNGG